MQQDLLVAVDVGTGSARAGVVTATGTLLGRAEIPITMHRTDANHAEHDSEQVWDAVVAAVRAAMGLAGAAPEAVVGIGFDATCSLVVRDRQGQPLSVSQSGAARWDTVVWLDHRALAEARECTQTGHEVLDFAGGVMSPEMQVPKLMWLKRHLPQTWEQAGYFFDLADFLTWKASGSLARSSSTLTCKWNYLGHAASGWQRDFFARIGLSDLFTRGALPETAMPAGSDLGPLSPEAALALGLTARCRVGAGLIDAHAGAMGVLGAFAADPKAIKQHLALITGTSNSILSLSRTAQPLAGVWGPYFGAILPDCWLTEAGQSAAGALLDHIIRLHSAGGQPTAERHNAIAERIGVLRASQGEAFAARLHVVPDFHGNRSPLADPYALGVVSGLTLDSDFDSLCRLYWRSAVGIALGIRQILETLNPTGVSIGSLHLTGGHTKNPLLMALYADVTGCVVVEPAAGDAVLLGTAMAAASAAGLHQNLAQAGTAMAQVGRERRPDGRLRAAYERDYRIFLEMLKQRKRLDDMAGTEPD